MNDNELTAGTTVRPRQGVGQMAEVSGNTGLVGGTPTRRRAGLYRHPKSGAELVTLEDPLYGDAQSRAAERTGFEYVGPAPEGYVKVLGAPSLDHAEKPDRAVEAQTAYNKGVEARLNALEAENARLRSQAESGNPVPGTEPVKGADETKQAAADKTEKQTGAAVDPKTGSERVEMGDQLPVEDGSADVKDTSFKELQAEAKELGVNAKGSKEELTQRVAEAKAEKESKNG
jgi:hypothetical protein